MIRKTDETKLPAPPYDRWFKEDGDHSGIGKNAGVINVAKSSAKKLLLTDMCHGTDSTERLVDRTWHQPSHYVWPEEGHSRYGNNFQCLRDMDHDGRMDEASGPDRGKLLILDLCYGKDNPASEKRRALAGVVRTLDVELQYLTAEFQATAKDSPDRARLANAITELRMQRADAQQELETCAIPRSP
ncbi:MAG: hypothetical protein HY903_16800 [Deltaproteobacteria bacterium]|nr:hypothetical protein [Deltaproteobacteria bacterium]